MGNPKKISKSDPTTDSIEKVLDSLPENLKTEFNLNGDPQEAVDNLTQGSGSIIRTEDIEYIKLKSLIGSRSISPVGFLNSNDKLEIFSLSYLLRKGYKINHHSERESLIASVVSDGVCDSILSYRDKLQRVLEE